MNANPRHSKLAWAFVIVGLTLSISGLGYLWYAGRPRQLEKLVPGEPPPLPSSPTQLQAFTDALLLTFLLILAFIVGSFVMIRLGRMFLSKSPLGGRTQYVDGWGAYRLSDADIDAATTSDPDEDDGADTPPEAPPIEPR